MNVRLGFSGSETAPDPGRLVDRVIRNLPAVLPDVRSCVTGGAAGVDHQAFFSSRYAYPQARHLLALPRDFRYQEVLLDWAREHGDPVVWADGPMERNDVIVGESDVLVAFPETGVEAIRSGTWATIRRARKAGLGIFIFPLDGSYPWTEGAGWVPVFAALLGRLDGSR